MAPNKTSEAVGSVTQEELQGPAPGAKEILCDGYFYDVTNFVKKHPGGSIIEYYTKNGEDATHAIQQFHQRSIKRVRVMMSSFKKRPALDSELEMDSEKLKKNRALTEDFTKLYLELEKEGMFKPSYIQNVLRLVELVAMGALGYFLIQSQFYFVKFIGILLIALVQGRSGWIQHESGHHSFSGNPKFDRLFHSIIFGLGLGLSSTWWARGHNRHHAMPQRLKHDVDLDTMPLLAYNAKVVKNAKQGKGFLIQNQVYLFLLVDTLLGTLIWQLYLHPRYVLKHKFHLQMLSMIGHYVLAYQIGFWPWLLSTWFMSMYLFGNFALSHSFLPVTEEPTHWVEYSLVHTADVEQVPWCNWWMGFLNYQIEHHLFPTMPQFRHPLIKDRVKALADKHKIPYVVYSYAEAMQKTFQNLSNVAKELKHS
jgi:fatty acid desaturase